MLSDAILPRLTSPPFARERRRARAERQPATTLRELFTLARSTDPSARNSRGEQLREMLGTAPIAFVASAATTSLFAAHLAGQPGVRGLGRWCAAMFGLLLRASLGETR